jgi:hypothetical protein
MLSPPSPTFTASPTEDADEVATGVVFSPTVEPPDEVFMVTPGSCWMNWVSPALAITTCDYLTFFPPFVKAHSVATHPLESGWYARRIQFDSPLEQFREQTAWSHVVATMRTDGRYWDNTIFTYQLAQANGTPIGTITLAKACTGDAEFCPPITTYWAMHEFLLPTYFLLSQAVQWPARTGFGSFYQELLCLELLRWAQTAYTPIGLPAGLFTAPAWPASLRLRIVKQSYASMDLAWVHSNSGDCYSGTTQFILCFQTLEGYPLSDAGITMSETLVMMGGLLSSMLGRDINNMLRLEDARIPITPPRVDKPPAPGTPLQ